MRATYERLAGRFRLGELDERRSDLAFADVGSDFLRPALSELRDVEGFTHLVLLTAVDWIEEGQFQLTYLVNNRARDLTLGLRLMIDRENARAEAVHDLWPTAATYQRELFEMFGIVFPGSPRLTEEFILEGWTGPPPYRRDFDTKAFSDQNFVHREGRATLDPRAHMKQKLYPDGG